MKLQIMNTEVTINKNGLYCLNDLHKAAVAAGMADENSHRPSIFKTSQHEFIEACITASETIISVKGGKSGTYASEIIAMKFAGWINPTYEVQLYKAVQALKRGDIEKAVELSGSERAKSALDEMRISKSLESRINSIERLTRLLPDLGKESKQSLAASLINPLAGFDVIPMPRIESKLYTASDIAEATGISANMVGRIANQHDMKQEDFGIWVLDKAKGHSKQVKTFQYNQKGFDAMCDLIANPSAGAQLQ